jgi:hypothetical protein
MQGDQVEIEELAEFIRRETVLLNLAKEMEKNIEREVVQRGIDREIEIEIIEREVEEEMKECWEDELVMCSAGVHWRSGKCGVSECPARAVPKVGSRLF